jgi:hypothetical protein
MHLLKALAIFKMTLKVKKKKKKIPDTQFNKLQGTAGPLRRAL